MKIKLIINHGLNEESAFFQSETEITVTDGDDAELRGREFAILDAAAVKGMMDAQKVTYQTGDGD